MYSRGADAFDSVDYFKYGGPGCVPMDVYHGYVIVTLSKLLYSTCAFYPSIQEVSCLVGQRAPRVILI